MAATTQITLFNITLYLTCKLHFDFSLFLRKTGGAIAYDAECNIDVRLKCSRKTTTIVQGFTTEYDKISKVIKNVTAIYRDYVIGRVVCNITFLCACMSLLHHLDVFSLVGSNY